jgi:hypothetical protein
LLSLSFGLIEKCIEKVKGARLVVEMAQRKEINMGKLINQIEILIKIAENISLCLLFYEDVFSCVMVRFKLKINKKRTMLLTKSHRELR